VSKFKSPLAIPRGIAPFMPIANNITVVATAKKNRSGSTPLLVAIEQFWENPEARLCRLCGIT